MTLKQYTTNICDDRARLKRASRAFSLLEVMIAAGIFFMAIFAILELVTANIRNARLLQQTNDEEKAAMLLADAVQTNKFEEGSVPVDLSAVYPGYSGECVYTAVGSNLCRIDAVVTKDGGGPVTTLSTLAYGQISQ